ncbi:NOL1/NOP2/sun family putative RNA methylase [Candidatus Woesearchaeota archaeon]|nr:NOL1/NOP2/sun family putative RNA methylase [Candidatus Woesearchaeota archaeon]
MEEIFKEKFIERYKELTDIDKFIEYSKKPLRKSIRVNTLKAETNDVKRRFEKRGYKLEKIPWCKEGFWIDGYTIGNTTEHFLGYIYLQEAASMIPPLALMPKAGEKVLDMCASPGSKTTQIAALMNNQGIIIANDDKIDRLKPLTINLQRCGVSNVVITLMKGQWFGSREEKFDRILVDAPCSGTGAIRKSFKIAQMWNPNMIKKLANDQRRLISSAFESLKQGGTLVYSTCTLEPEENEGVVDFLLNEYTNASLEGIELNLKSNPPVLNYEGREYNKEIKKCLRIWPQDNDSEGFFIAKIIKK